MRQIQITEDPYLKIGMETYYLDDLVTIDDVKAQQWINAGWAKDPITGEQGKRKPGAQALQVDKVKQKAK